MLSYRIQTHQPFSAAATNANETFTNTMLQQPDDAEVDVENIWFSNETYFSLEGYFNKNCHIWESENLHVDVPSFLNPQKSLFGLPFCQKD